MAARPDFESPEDNSTKQVDTQKTSQPADNPSYPIMTINMNGRGTAAKRRELLSLIFKLYPSAIVCCQEPCGKFDEVIPKKFSFVKTGKEAAIIWSTEHFDRSQDGPKTTDAQIRSIRDEICDENNDASQLLSRITMVELTPLQESTESILVVSFHGPHKGFNEGKSVFLSLLKFLDKVIEKKNIRSYIIGGDFNFDTRTITKIPNLPENVVVGSYELSPRLQNSARVIRYKDNFIYYPKQNLNVFKIKAVDLDNIDFEEGNKLLDHDPIVGMLDLTPQTEESSPSEDNSASEESSPSEVVENLSKDVKDWKPFEKARKK